MYEFLFASRTAMEWSVPGDWIAFQRSNIGKEQNLIQFQLGGTAPGGKCNLHRWITKCYTA